MKPASCLVFAGLALSMAACAPFEPTRPATRPGDYTEAGISESLTMRDESVRYEPSVLALGAPRASVHAAFGSPNAARTTDGGVIEDVYAFNPDGSKFVNPELRARNVALGFFTMGISVAVRQARLALIERKLTLVHVFYTPNDTIARVDTEPLPGAPATLPSG